MIDRILAPVRFARMAGSSIAAPDAAPWITDFVNAAYHRRPRDERRVEDYRLAWAILTTRWHQLGGRRLHVPDLAPVVRAFGVRRFVPGRGWGTLAPDALMEGATRLIGDWFADAWADPARRGWGVVFEDEPARAAFDPDLRLRHAALGVLTPPVTPGQQTWHTYEPVRVAAGAAAAAAALAQADRWTEWATPLARFTALRPGPTAPGQTFEIDVLAEPAPGLPVLSRGYVTATDVLGPGPQLDAEVAAMGDRLGAPLVPAGGSAAALVKLTTHDGHFLGRAISHLLAFDHDGSGWVRDVGCWDRLPVHLAATYRLAGRSAQERLWGPGDPQASMIEQLALWIAARPQLH